MSNKCIYHCADLDGKCAGAIVKRYVPDAEMIGMDYHVELDLDRFGRKDTVYMVDFSLQPWDRMIELANRVKRLVWIDHHATAMKQQQKNPHPKIESFTGTTVAACELAWAYFNANRPDPKPMPLAVKLLGRYDVWDHADSWVVPFQYRMKLEVASPESGLWKELFDTPYRLENMIIVGQQILRYQQQQWEAHAMETCFVTMLPYGGRDITCLAMNGSPTWNGMAFGQLHETACADVLLKFCFMPTTNGKGPWKVSLYARDKSVDVGQIAKAYGGGGHAGAAGFQCHQLPFKLPGDAK